MSEKETGEMSFLEHLEELRWHIMRSIIILVIISTAAFIFKHFVFDIVILGPSKSDFITTRWLCRMGEILNTKQLCLNQKPFRLQSIEMAGQFLAHIKISLISGLVVAFPFIFYEIWRFISPALYTGERKVANGAVLAISLLFFLGVLFGYFIICPLSVNFLFNYQVSEVAENNIRLMSYVSTISSIGLASGVMFELPIIVYFLSKIGLLTPDFLKKYRKHAIIIILLLAAVITPPDIFSQILVSLPLLLLYEISITISRRINKKREKNESAYLG